MEGVGPQILRGCVALCHFHQELSVAMTNTVCFKWGKLRHRQDAHSEVYVLREGKKRVSTFISQSCEQRSSPNFPRLPLVPFYGIIQS